MDTAMVAVHCSVYNHGRYLRKCLESLVEQRTDFRYVIVVNDDASTDDSADIIREYADRYPDLILPILHKENLFSQGISRTPFMFAKCDAKYIAICEGDDFWTDPDKLQKQVDYMETHPDYSLCVHASYCAHEDGSYFTEKFFRPYDTSRTITMQDIFGKWRFATNSMLYRRTARPEYVVPFRGDCSNGDYALTVYLALHGKVYYIDELMSAYRVESVNSLNWKWRADKSKYIDARERFIQMLIRIDDYTDHQYSADIGVSIDRARFEIAIVGGDYMSARSYPQYYKDLPIKTRAKLLLGYRCPGLYKCLRRIAKSNT